MWSVGPHRRVATTGVGAEQQVVDDRQTGEDLTALGHQADPGAGAPLGDRVADVLTGQDDGTGPCVELDDRCGTGSKQRRTHAIGRLARCRTTFGGFADLCG
jgi:hypothetical protein